MQDSKQFQRIVNRSLVLQKLRENGGISRIEISRQLGLDRSTITNIVSPLIHQNLVKILSQGDSPSKGGRRPELLGLNDHFGIILGIDLQISHYQALLINLNGDVLKEWRGSVDYINLMDNLKIIYDELRTEIEAFSIPLLGIGVGIPGVVDSQKGIVIKSSSLKCHKLNYSELAKKEFDIPLIIDNDANCCAWGQLELNKGEKIDNFLSIIWKLHRNEGESAPEEIEFGIGIVLDGVLYSGSSFSAGELPEDLISNVGGELFVKKRQTWEFNPLKLFPHLENLFKHLLPFFYIFDPGILYFGGQFVKCKSEINKLLMGHPFPIKFSEGIKNNTAFGAASMFMEKLFKIPGSNQDGETKVLKWQDLLDR